MKNRICVVGATGVVGKRLLPLLVDARYDVFGTTRSAQKTDEIAQAGACPVVVDVYDGAKLGDVLTAVAPEVVIHQVTDLPPGLPPSEMASAAIRNARVRAEGTRNIITAAIDAHVSKVIAQSIAWSYAPGPEPHPETDPLDLTATGPRLTTLTGVMELERLVMHSSLDGVVLRYGRLYGPGTGSMTAGDPPSVHVDAAAHAALLAAQRVRFGVFNIVENDGYAGNTRAIAELGWDPRFRAGDARVSSGWPVA